jgi:uncharacterized protein
MAQLDLRPNCECCDKNLPPDSTDAMICSFECTFCRDCVDTILHGVCPNCDGNLAPRPIRPLHGTAGGLQKHPASMVRIHTKRPCATSITIAPVAPHS